MGIPYTGVTPSEKSKKIVLRNKSSKDHGDRPIYMIMFHPKIK